MAYSMCREPLGGGTYITGRKIMLGIRTAACLVVASCGCSSAFAGMMNASSVEHFDQGLTKNGSAVASNRSDPTAALGAPELTDTLNFVSLGIGGSLILGFDSPFAKESVIVWETTYGNPANYPESAEIWIGSGETWDSADFLFVSDLANDEDGMEISLATLLTEVSEFHYLKIIDTTDISIHNGNADGFDVDGVSVTAIPTPGSVGLAFMSAGVASRRRRR